MNDLQKALEIATINAATAIDQRHEYADSRASYRQNVVQTLVEQGLVTYYHEALEAYDAHIKANWPRLTGPDAFALLRSANPSQRSILTYTVVAPVRGDLPDVEGVYQDFNAACKALEDVQRVYPKRKYSVVVSFIRLAA